MENYTWRGPSFSLLLNNEKTIGSGHAIRLYISETSFITNIDMQLLVVDFKVDIYKELMLEYIQKYI